MNRAEQIRRLKAARALGGYTKPETLGQHPLLVENGIKESRIREFESIKGRASPAPMELAVIAKACGLPEEFFYAGFERMAIPSEAEQLADLKRHLSAIGEALETLLDEDGARRLTRAVRDAGRAFDLPGEESQRPPGATGSNG